METAFNLFYQLGLELSPLLNADHILVSQPSIVENVGRAFSELLNIVSVVAIRFYSAVYGDSEWTRLDIYVTFSAPIENFRSRVTRCFHHMWAHQLCQHGFDDEDGQFELLRKWLAPQDSVLAFLAANRISLVAQPEEYTCTWIQPQLNHFFRNEEKVLVIEGKTGSGKTTLANWVLNRLQRPIGGKSVSTLSFFYGKSEALAVRLEEYKSQTNQFADSNIAANATSLGMLKAFLYQLMSLNIGDIGLFKAISKAHAESKKLSSAEAQEEGLWKAFQDALEAIADDEGDTLTLIVDGIDEMNGQKPAAKRVSAKLHELARGIPGVRVIQFSQPLDLALEPSTEKIELSLDNIGDDIQAVVRQGLYRLPHFADRDYISQENIVDDIVAVSDDSMLSASLYTQYLLLQNTLEDFNKAVQDITKAPRTISDHVQRLLMSTKPDQDSQAVLSFLVSAQRPLSLNEIELLLRANSKGAGLERTIDTSSIIRTISAFTVASEGLVAIKHNAIERALLSIPDNSPVSLHLKERHKDLLMRLFANAKSHLWDTGDELRLEFLTPAEVERKVGTNHLLEYTVRYWTTHFKLSSLYKVQGDLQLPKEFALVFPTSVTFALLEAGCWQTQSSPHVAIELLTIAFRVRKALFDPKTPNVLQSAIICAIFYDTVLARPTDAVQWYAQVIKIGRVFLNDQSGLLITCCQNLLQISETLITKTRTEIMTYREEVLLLLVSSYTHRYGASSRKVLEIYEELNKLYIYISEETKALEIQKKIQELNIVIHGGRREEHDAVDRHLDVYLKKHKHAKEVDSLDVLLGGYTGELEESWTIGRVEDMLLFALELIKSQQFAQAEEVYLDLWLRLTQHCRTTQECEWHEKKIEVMLAYSSFLTTHKRVEEASAVLICCWNEYAEHQVSVFESVILQLKKVAVSMKTIGLVSLSLTVFQKCWSWFKSTHRESSTEFKQIEEYIATTSKEIVKSTSTSTSTSTTITTSSESVIREVFEESFASSSEETVITTTTVELCQSLTSIYTEQQRWSEAISVIKSTLKKSWTAFFSESIESITMTETFSSESVELVLKLASCYINEKRFEKAEDLYLRLYRVHRKVYGLDHASVVRFGDLYLEFLKQHDMFGQVISFYQELLVQYRSLYGHSDAKTIAVLYSLGDICRRHHLTHGYWIEYYLEIVTTLNKGALVCHEDAFRALLIVAEHYYETLRYSESLNHFRSIVATFVKSGTKFGFFEDQAAAQALFEKYYRAIEETKVEVQEHVKLLREIREACCQHYGNSSTAAVSATVVLAETCSRSEKFEYEAASYYEHILKNSKTVSTTVARRSESTLKSLYVKQATSTSSSSSSSSTTTVTKEMIEKATAMTYKRYTEIRKTHSCTHEETLTHLRELVTLYQRQEKSELAVQELRSLVVDTFTSVTSSRELLSVARDVAAIYASGGYVAQGLALVRELKLQVVYKTASKGCGFDVTKAGRSSFAFITSLEDYLRADHSLTVAAYMVELMAEHLYYERFVSSVATKAKTEIVVLHAARLREILYRTGRGADFDAIVERQAVEYFATVEAAVVKKSSKASAAALVRVLLVHFSERAAWPKNFVGSAGHAAVEELTRLLAAQRYQAALELARCTFAYLMAHEGLDDPTEITLGFQLCLMMAGRGEHSHPTADAALSNSMLDLSRAILAEVFAICEASRIDLARCPLAELNELAGLVGDQKDYARLRWLLNNLWTSREGQSSWTPDVILTLGRRLVQAQFAGGNHVAAIRLAEDLVYNVRRVHGPRHKQTLDMYALLASLYTSAGQHCQAQMSASTTTPPAGNGKGGNNAQQQANAEAKQRMAGPARTYFKKAIFVNEEVLKLIVDATAEDSDAEDDGDQYSVASGFSNRGSMSARGRGLGSQRSSSHLTRLVAGVNGNGNTETNGREADNVNGGKTVAAAAATATVTQASSDPEAPSVLAEAARRHLRLLKLAVQRFGGWGRPTAGRQVHTLTAKVWRELGPELKLKEDEVLSSKWRVDGFGAGKAEAGLEEDGFKVPASWAIY